MVNNVLNALAGANAALNTSQFQLSTGKTINKPNDDISSWAIARRSESTTRINTALNQTLDDFIAMLQAHIDMLSEMRADAQRVYELTFQAQAGNTVMSADEVNALALAAIGIATKWSDDNLAQYTYNGNILGDASLDFSALIVNEGASVAGGAAQVVFVGSANPALAALGDYWDQMGLARDSDLSASGLGSPTDTFDIIGEDLGNILAVVTDLTFYVANMESWQRQIQQAQALNTASGDAAEARRAFNEDVDIASASVSNTRLTILQQIATAELAAANTAASQVLGLF
ncbi:MAG: hypothetical protein KGZ58_03035 [Ignavibacteriales bacterium]|nr:hypothetical protein [Ignavibacteriales bacterium]